MITIEKIEDSRIDHYRSLRFTPAVHTNDSVFIAEGLKVFGKLLDSNFEIISVFALKEFYLTLSEKLNNKKIPPDQQFVAEKELMTEIVGFKLHSGIMAIVKQPTPPRLDELSSPIIVMNGIINSENVGAIIRNCVAFGVDSIIVDRQTASPYLRRSVRVSMGNVIDTKVHFSVNLCETLQILKEKFSYKILSAELTEQSIRISDAEFDGKIAIIFGGEGKGVNKDILELSNAIVEIPISTNVPSLNVAATSAIFLHEITRRKNLRSI